MPQYDEETGEQLIEVQFRDTWYGDILRKPDDNPHLMSIKWKGKLPKTAKILSVLEEDEFEEVKADEEAIKEKHAHGLVPAPLSELAKVAKPLADKRPKRQYRRKAKKG